MTSLSGLAASQRNQPELLRPEVEGEEGDGPVGCVGGSTRRIREFERGSLSLSRLEERSRGRRRPRMPNLGKNFFRGPEVLVSGARGGGEDVLDVGDAVPEGARRNRVPDTDEDQLFCYCDLRSAQTQYKEQMYEIFCIKN